MTADPKATDASQGPRTNDQGPRTNRRWIWFFVTLAVLTVLAITVLAVYNLRLQLKPEQLAAARKLWEQKGPRDYQFKYTVRTGDERDGDEFVVQVRGSTVTSVKLNGRLLDKDKYIYHSMDAKFDEIEEFLKKDAEKGRPRTYTRALFDSADGHLLHFVRRVMGTRERVEITVESLEPLPPAQAGRQG
jgi:hypothetical protein